MDEIPSDRHFLRLKGPNILIDNPDSAVQVVSAFIDDDLDLVQLFTD
jgi:hypothetical protein